MLYDCVEVRGGINGFLAPWLMLGLPNAVAIVTECSVLYNFELSASSVLVMNLRDHSLFHSLICVP